MKTKELREKSIGELEKLLFEKEELVRKTRFDISTRQAKDNRKLRNSKREIARIITLINEKKKDAK